MSCQIEFNTGKCGIITHHNHVPPLPIRALTRVMAAGVCQGDGDVAPDWEHNQATAQWPLPDCCLATREKASGTPTGPVN